MSLLTKHQNCGEPQTMLDWAKIPHDWGTAWDSRQKSRKECLFLVCSMIWKPFIDLFKLTVLCQSVHFHNEKFNEITGKYLKSQNFMTLYVDVPHHLMEFAQIYVHCINDDIQPSHPLSPSSPSTFNLSQHQVHFQWVSSSYHMSKVVEIQLQHQSLQWTFRVDFL